MRAVLAFLCLTPLLGCSTASTSVGPSDAGDDVSTGDTATDTGSGTDSAAGDSAADSAAGDSAAVDSARTDSAGGDVAPDVPSADVRVDGGPVCTDPATFPKFEKGCGEDKNCVVGMHQINCCGSMLAIGMNHGVIDAFNTAEKAWAATCPKCGCPTLPPVDESGKTGSGFDAKCIGGKCTSVAK